MIEFQGCGGPVRPADAPPCIPTVLRAYPSAAIFLSYPKNSWSDIVQANADDLASNQGPLMTFAPGTLVNDNGTIYVVDGDWANLLITPLKHGIPDAATFLSLGYKWSNVVSGDISSIAAGDIISASNAHLPGALINQNGTIYCITQYGKIVFTSIDDFTSRGFKLKNVVPANSQDAALPTDTYGWHEPGPQ